MADDPAAAGIVTLVHDHVLCLVYFASAAPCVQSFEVNVLRLLETVATEQRPHTIGPDRPTQRVLAYLPPAEGAIVYEEAAQVSE